MNLLNPEKHKQTVKEMNKTIQNLKIETIKKHKLEMKILDKSTGTIQRQVSLIQQKKWKTESQELKTQLKKYIHWPKKMLNIKRFLKQNFQEF